MKLRRIVFLAFVMVLLAACGGEDNGDAEQELDTKEIKELVHDYTINNLEAESAAITSTELIIENDNEEQVYELPEEEFFVSIAPFIDETHPCEVHSLSGCQAELVEEEFDLHITDSAGNVILDETKSTEANGFIDLWLPRDDEYVVRITQDNRTTESKISTFEGDNTCITTMQLS